MTTRTKVLALAALVGLAAPACSTSVTGPSDPERVELDVRVTGGIAGVDYRIRIDGADREVRYTCLANCISSYEPFLSLTTAQWNDLVDQVVRAGIPGMGTRDFGGTCCDQFMVEIGYDDGMALARVTGDDSTLPPAVAEVARRLLRLRDGVVPALIRPGAAPGSGPSAQLDVDELQVDGLVLEAAVNYTGGCERHAVDLVFDGAWQESAPVQTAAWLTHDDRDDPCDARPHEVRRFDLAPLADAYRAAYPGAGGGTVIVVHVTAPGGGSTHTVEIVLP